MNQIGEGGGHGRSNCKCDFRWLPHLNREVTHKCETQFIQAQQSQWHDKAQGISSWKPQARTRPTLLHSLDGKAPCHAGVRVRRYSSTHYHPRQLTDVCGHLHAPGALPPGKETGTRWTEDWLDPQRWSGHDEERSRALPGIESRSSRY